MLRLPARTNTRRAAPADDHAVTELVLYAENTGSIYERYILPTIKSLATKLSKETYDKDRAVDAFVYVADAAAKQYNAEFGSGQGYGPFTVATRRAAAASMLDNAVGEIEYYAEQLTAKGAKRVRKLPGAKPQKSPVRNGAGGKATRNGTPSSKLMIFPNALQPNAYDYFQWEPKHGSKGIVHAIFGVPYPALSFAEAKKVSEYGEGLTTKTYRGGREDLVQLHNKTKENALRVKEEQLLGKTPRAVKMHNTYWSKRHEQAKQATRTLVGVKINGLALAKRNGEAEAEIQAAFKSALDTGSVLEGVSVAHQAKYDKTLPQSAKIGTGKIGTGPQGKGVAVQFAVTSGKKKLGTGYYKPKHGSVWVTWG